jgi:zinc transport system permease protein
MSEPQELPEGLSLDDLELEPEKAPGVVPQHVHESSRDAEDQGFDHTHSEHHPVDHSHEAHHATEAQPTLDGFIDGWNLGLYRDAVLAGALASAALALVGVFIVLRRAVFAAATVGQAAGLGVVLAFYLGIHWGLELPPLMGALACAATATAALATRSTRRKLPQDALLGLGFLVASAGAIALGDRITQEAHEVSAILFGTAVVVSPSDVGLLAALFVAVLALVTVGWRGVAFAGFDPDGAQVQGLPVRVLDLGFWLLVAVTVAVTTRVIGALPVFAFSVLPALAAVLGTSSLAATLAASSLIAVGCASAGYVAAYFMALPVGATQALCCALVLGLVLSAHALGAILQPRRRQKANHRSERANE